MRITLDGESFDLTTDLVRARVDGHVPERIRDYWVEIGPARWPVKQVISLATGVTERQRFQSQSSRRWLENLGFTIGKGNSPLPVAPRRALPQEQPDPPRSSESGGVSDVILLSCVKTKREHGAPAKDLYVSDYFMKMRAYAEASGRPWFILSAEHGLLHPDDWVEPYERYLPDTPRGYRKAWGQKAAAQLEMAVGPLGGLAIEVHAGAAYVECLEVPLRTAGAHIIERLRGLSIGHRLSWYLHQAASADEQGVIAALRDPDSARTLPDIIASTGSGLRSPGLYSWWVDEAGAADLEAGLGHPIGAGLVYAGLAGATRSGGSTSSNTLWGRITTMHLGKKHEFSTLRRSLGSVLAHAYGQQTIDEAQLTRWMYAHLRVVTISVTNADALDALETRILGDLDPPLNLAKVGRTALRQRLTTLRRQYGGAAAKDG